MAQLACHKSVEANDDATFFYNIGSPSQLEISHRGKVERSCTIPLFHNTLLLLAGEALCDYRHKITPLSNSEDFLLFESEVEAISRISLLLRLQKIPYVQMEDRSSLIGGLIYEERDDDERALELIFGDRKYNDFSAEEKMIVDNYQDKMFKEDLYILPNTGLAQEQLEISRIIYGRKE